MKGIEKMSIEDFKKREQEARSILQDIDIRRLVPKKIKRMI